MQNEQTPAVYTRETITVQLSNGRTAEIRELSAFDQIQADAQLGPDENAQVALTYLRTLASMCKLDGTVLPPASALELKSRSHLFSGRDLETLTAAYIKHFAAQGDDLGNESARDISAPV